MPKEVGSNDTRFFEISKKEIDLMKEKIPTKQIGFKVKIFEKTKL